MKKLTNYLVFIKFLFVILAMTMNCNFLYSQACVSCDGTTTSGLFPSAIGRYTKATANYSFAGGIYSEAKGSASFAFGNRAFAEGGSSAALGQFARVNTSTAMVFGAGFDIDNPLINSETHSLMIGFGSTKPTLFVGRSIGVNNTGKVGIGNVTDPQAKLHIRADDGMIGEDATLMLEVTKTGKSNKILMQGGHAYIGTTSERYSLNFFTGEGNNRMIIDGESGNVGIGTTAPTSRLDVAGNAHVSGDLIINNTTAISSGRIGRFANGTASAPAYSFSGNINTGMFQPATDILAFSTGGTERVRIASNGDVGIGTNSPASTLHVKRSSGSSQVLVVESVTGNSGILLKSNAQNKGYFWWDNASQFMAVGPGSISNSIIFKESNLGVGCTPSDQYKLEVAGAARLNGSLYITDNNNVYVNGEIHAKKFRATYNPWPDYVFDPDYELPGLCEIEYFVTTNRHLPGLPSAAEVETEGFELAEMNGLLLKKIEELTLYLIDQQKEINALKEKMSRIETQ
jgi:hypothetical protein